LIEIQIFPYDISGRIEDGRYAWQRQAHGVFSLSADYKDGREGGSAGIALVPSTLQHRLDNHFPFVLKYRTIID
jgi:hypothetical protein